MKLASKLKLAVLLGILAAIPVVHTIDGRQVSAHEGGGHVHAQEQAPAQDAPAPAAPAPAATAAPVVYSYVAQPGDSYAVLARKAVQTYGKKFNVRLSRAKIIFAETSLTQAAKSPQLEIGQKVTITEAQVKQQVDAAKKLSAAQEAAWSYYVQFADFNTDHAGEAH